MEPVILLDMLMVKILAPRFHLNTDPRGTPFVIIPALNAIKRRRVC